MERPRTSAFSMPSARMTEAVSSPKSSNACGTWPSEPATPAWSNRITSRFAAKPSVTAGSQLSIAPRKCTQNTSGGVLPGLPNRRYACRAPPASTYCVGAVTCVYDMFYSFAAGGRSKGSSQGLSLDVDPAAVLHDMLRAALYLSLGSSGRTPKGTRIGAVGIKLQHLVIELAGGFCRVIQPNEVTDILARFFHISRVVIVAGNLMSRNDCQRLQGVDFVKRGNPFDPSLPVRLAEKRVNAVIDGIAGGNQSNGWDVKARRIIGVCMADLDDDQLVSFQIELIALQRIGDRNDIGNLIREKLTPPAIHFFRRDLQLHFGDYRGCGQCFRARKSVLQNFYPEEMIAMGMSDIDCLQRLSARNNGVCQAVGLLHGEEGIHQHRVPLSIDQSRRIGDPRQGLLAGRHIAVQARASDRKHLVLQRRRLTLRTCHDCSRRHRKHDQGSQLHHIATIHAKPRFQRRGIIAGRHAVPR